MAAISNPITAGMVEHVIDCPEQNMKVNMYIDEEDIECDKILYLNASFIATSTLDQTVTERHFQLEIIDNSQKTAKSLQKFLKNVMVQCVFLGKSSYKFRCFTATSRHLDVPTVGIVANVPLVSRSRE